ncbi:hypothetical protein ACVWXL_001529 [Bradyrhizobium sp. GM22.5]
MAGSAMLAIAVSSDAIASAVKIAAMAQRRCAAGRPSEMVWSGSRAPAGNVIVIALARCSGGRLQGTRHVLRRGRLPQAYACMLCMREGWAMNLRAGV